MKDAPFPSLAADAGAYGAALEALAGFVLLPFGNFFLRARTVFAALRTHLQDRTGTRKVLHLIVTAAVTLALCGAVYGLELLKHGRVRPGALWYPVTFSSLELTAGGVYAATRLLLPRLSHAPDSVVPVRLTLGGRRVFLSALRDSGNTLCDPVTGEAVLVADWRCAARLLPHDGLRAADFAAPAALVVRLQRLHFRAGGTGSGLLLALPCEEVRIGKRVQKNGLVAFSPTPVSDGGGYEALTGGKCDA